MLRRAVELGVNFIDTADSYGPDVSETLIAEALYPYPDGLVIATKGGLERPGPGRWVPNGAPEHLVRACEGSLAASAPGADPAVPVPPARPAGAARGVGRRPGRAEAAGQDPPHRAVQRRRRPASSCPATDADRVRPEPLQPHRSQLGVDGRPLRAAGHRLLALGADPGGRRAGRERDRSQRTTPASVRSTLAWLLARSTVMLPIPGTGSVAHLEDNVAAAGLRLGDDEIAALDAAGNKDSRLRRSLRSARSSLRSRTSR